MPTLSRSTSHSSSDHKVCMSHSCLHVVVSWHHSLTPPPVLLTCCATISITSSGSDSKPTMVRMVLYTLVKQAAQRCKDSSHSRRKMYRSAVFPPKGLVTNQLPLCTKLVITSVHAGREELPSHCVAVSDCYFTCSCLGCPKGWAGKALRLHGVHLGAVFRNPAVHIIHCSRLFLLVICCCTVC